ncbi:uncharacterized protein LACBIDRAFT_295521 [Laccaria bicolor S238N-H82]|uniref:Predicted protein n=1 Tax=Laccaria bicolor (strain S238N-H82 / ATCC MYA-4686) TaxID=486041 RepID=B0DTS3_LACBS|nr:uncharacterized protein LACBIDRAFT_295521 [Laccaria bicolor S238N-H82]EDR02032.1 predicted protein [Laccaria bicolor S238N-H82]|eukprot:XP_001887423.1 predicted protein [Laccaria bicolor S238N-H82]
MFALRRLSCRAPRALTAVPVRYNADLTVATDSPVAQPPPPPPPPAAVASEFAEDLGENTGTRGRRRRKRIPTKRPAISTESPRKWNRPLAEGVLPAYDMALKVIKTDSFRLKEEAKELRTRIGLAENTFQELSAKAKELSEDSQERQTLTEEVNLLDEQLEAMRVKLNILEVQSEINLPDVRHLVEQKWRKDGALDLLMERIYQMGVVPDVLPEIRPSLDLRVVAKTRAAEFLNAGKVQKEVEPGVYLLPKQTLEPPKLYVNVFHEDTRLYTMLLVDPDVPDVHNESFTTFLHWMKPNIPLSCEHTQRILDLNTHTKYIPPHPQQGTPYHRYVLLLLPQPPLGGAAEYTMNTIARAQPGVPTSEHLDIPIIPEEERLGFNVREFTRHWGLDARKGGGAHMWREIWNEDVSTIYKDILQREEPRYGRPPKVDPYADVKRSRKYIS